MAQEAIKEGFEVFASETGKPFGAVRQVSPHGRSELVIYVENSGEYIVPLGAVAAVHGQKVVLNVDKLDKRLRTAIAHAHDAEDPNISLKSARRILASPWRGEERRAMS